MPANKSIFHAGGSYRNYWHLLENTGKYWKIEFAILELSKKKKYIQH